MPGLGHQRGTGAPLILSGSLLLSYPTPTQSATVLEPRGGVPKGRGRVQVATACYQLNRVPPKSIC